MRFLGISALVVVSVLFYLWMSARDGSEVRSGPDNFGAFFICKQFVTDRLKAPASAVFPLSNANGVNITKLDSTQYRVNAYVDSQNDFGASIRTRYTCTVRYTGNDGWQLEALTTDP